MSIRNCLATFLALLSLAYGSTAMAQSITLETGFTPASSSFKGQMFDVSATNSITVTSFSVQFGTTGAGAVRVWGRPGTHVGFETNQTGWTLLGTGSTTGGSLQPIALTTTPSIPAGQTYAFHIEGASALFYRTAVGSVVGDTIASDANVAIRAGQGLQGAFSANRVSPRALAGSMTYSLPVTAAPVPTLSEWALILFGVILAGGAALYIQRRRGIEA